MSRLPMILVALTTCSAFGADPSPEALVKAGHWKRARPLAEQRYQVKHGDAQSAYLLSRVKFAFGDLSGALELAEKAVGLEGSNASYHYQLAVVCGETADHVSLFNKAGWARRFKGEAERAAALDPKNLEARFGLLEYYLQAPRLMGGGKDKARALADEIAKIDLARGALAQARLAEDAKDATQQEAQYGKALEAAPRDYEVLISVAEFYLKSRKRPELAEQHAREALALDSGEIRAYSLLAAAYAGAGRTSDLETVLAEAQKNVPDDLDPYYQAGRALLAEGKDLARAERYFREYLSQEPEADGPTLAHAHWQLGLALIKQGQKPEAISEIETALRLKPDLREAKQDLARLK